jgi:hypothetical protein
MTPATVWFRVSPSSCSNADDERCGVAVPGVGLVHAAAGDRDDPGAGLQAGCDLGNGSQCCEVLVDEFPAVGKGRGPGCFPAGGFEQADGGGIDVEPPRGEQPDVAPLLNGGARRRTCLENQRFQAALEEVCRGCEAHGSCTDDGYRKALR